MDVPCRFGAIAMATPSLCLGDKGSREAAPVEDRFKDSLSLADVLAKIAPI